MSDKIINWALAYTGDNNTTARMGNRVEELISHIDDIKADAKKYVNRKFTHPKSKKQLDVIYPKCYKVDEHKNIEYSKPQQGKLSKEKMIAKALCRIGDSKLLNLVNEFSCKTDIGIFKDYEVPLFHSNSKDRGRVIDLVSVKGNTLYIIELKRRTSSETILRCLLEAYTYYLFERFSDRTKLRDHQEHIAEAFGIKENAKIVICPLIFKDSKAYRNLEKTYNNIDEDPYKIKEFVSAIKEKESNSDFDVAYAIIDPCDTSIEWPCDSNGDPFLKNDWLELK